MIVRWFDGLPPIIRHGQVIEDRGGKWHEEEMSLSECLKTAAADSSSRAWAAARVAGKRLQDGAMQNWLRRLGK